MAKADRPEATGKGPASTGLASATAHAVLARFSSSRGLFRAMLGQFLSAQAVQASEERVLFSLRNVLLFGHICTMIELQP